MSIKSDKIKAAKIKELSRRKNDIRVDILSSRWMRLKLRKIAYEIEDEIVKKKLLKIIKETASDILEKEASLAMAIKEEKEFTK